MKKTYIVEARNSDGTLNLKTEQPETIFGIKAIKGLTIDEMGKTIYGLKKDIVLTGDNIPFWPSLINPLWIAREKTW